MMTLVQNPIIKKMRDSKEYKNYKISIDKVLKIFENTEEWPDLISVLGKLQKLIQTYSNIPIIPRKFTIGKRLAQCLHPALPSGVHLKTLQIYDLIFETIGSETLYKDSAIYLCGIYPLFPKASLAIKPFVLELYEKYLLCPALPEPEPPSQPDHPMGGSGLAQEASESLWETAKAKPKHQVAQILVVEPSLMGLFLGTFPGIDPGSENLPKFYTILNTIYERISDRVYFFETLWNCVYSSPTSRLGALNYLLENKGRFSSDLTQAWHSDRKIIVRALNSSLHDKQLLVRRTALDIINSMMPLDRLCNKVRDAKEYQDSPMFSSLKILMNSVLGVLLERNSGLNKRVFAWIFSSPSQKKLSLPGPIYPKLNKDATLKMADDRLFEPSITDLHPTTTLVNPKRHKRTGSKDDTYYLMLKRSAGANIESPVLMTSSLTSSGYAVSDSDLGHAPTTNRIESELGRPGRNTNYPAGSIDGYGHSSSSSSSVTTSLSSAASRPTQGPSPSITSAIETTANSMSTRFPDLRDDNVNAAVREREYAYALTYAVPPILAHWRDTVTLYRHRSAASSVDPVFNFETEDPFQALAGAGAPFLILLTLVEGCESGAAPSALLKTTALKERGAGHRRKSSALSAREPFLSKILGELAFETLEYATLLNDGGRDTDALFYFGALLCKRGVDLVKLAREALMHDIKAELVGHDRALQNFGKKLGVWTLFLDVLRIFHNSKTVPELSTLALIPAKSRGSRGSSITSLTTDWNGLWTQSSCAVVGNIIDSLAQFITPPNDESFRENLGMSLHQILTFFVRALRLDLEIEGNLKGIPADSLPTSLEEIFIRAPDIARCLATSSMDELKEARSLSHFQDHPFFTLFHRVLVPNSATKSVHEAIIDAKDVVDDAQLQRSLVVERLESLERPGKDLTSTFAITEYDVTAPLPESNAYAYGGEHSTRHNSQVVPCSSGLLEKLCVAHYYFYLKYGILGGNGNSPTTGESEETHDVENGLKSCLIHANSSWDFNRRLPLYICMLSEYVTHKPSLPHQNETDPMTPILTGVVSDLWKNMTHECITKRSLIPSALLISHDALLKRHQRDDIDDVLDSSASRDLNANDPTLRHDALIKIDRLWEALGASVNAVKNSAFLPHTVLSLFSILLAHKDFELWDGDRVGRLANTFLRSVFSGPRLGAAGILMETEMAKTYLVAPILNPLLEILSRVWSINVGEIDATRLSDEEVRSNNEGQENLIARFWKRDPQSGEDSGMEDGLDYQSNQDDLVATHSIDLMRARRLSGDSEASNASGLKDTKGEEWNLRSTKVNDEALFEKAFSSAFYLVDQRYNYQAIAFSIRVTTHLIKGTFTSASLACVPHILMTKYPNTASSADTTVLEAIILACSRLSSAHYTNNSVAADNHGPPSPKIPDHHDTSPQAIVVNIKVNESSLFHQISGILGFDQNAPAHGDLKFTNGPIRSISDHDLASHVSVRLSALDLLDATLKTCLDFRETNPSLYAQAWAAVEKYEVLNHVLSSLYLACCANAEEWDNHVSHSRSVNVLLDVVRYNTGDSDDKLCHTNHLLSLLSSLALMSAPDTLKNNSETCHHYLLCDILSDVRFKLCLAAHHNNRALKFLPASSGWIRFMQLTQYFVGTLEHEASVGKVRPPAPLSAAIAALYQEMVFCSFLVNNCICHTLSEICRSQNSEYHHDHTDDNSSFAGELVERLELFFEQTQALVKTEVSGSEEDLKSIYSDITPRYWQNVSYHKRLLTRVVQQNSSLPIEPIGGHLESLKTACGCAIYYTPLYLECLVNCCNTFSHSARVQAGLKGIVEKHYIPLPLVTSDDPPSNQSFADPGIEELFKTLSDTFLLASVLRHVTMLTHVRSNDCIKPLQTFFARTVLKVADKQSSSESQSQWPTCLVVVSLIKLMVQLLKNPRLATILTVRLKSSSGESRLIKDMILAGTLDFLNSILDKNIVCLDTGQLNYLLTNIALVELLGLLKGSPCTLELIKTFHTCLTRSLLNHNPHQRSKNVVGTIEERDSEPKLITLIAHLRETFQAAFDSLITLSSGAISCSGWILFKKTPYVVQLPTAPNATLGYSNNVRIRKSGQITANGGSASLNQQLNNGGVRPSSMGEIFNPPSASGHPLKNATPRRTQQYSLSPTKKKRKSRLVMAPYHPDLVQAKGNNGGSGSPLSSYLRNHPQQSYDLGKGVTKATVPAAIRAYTSTLRPEPNRVDLETVDTIVNAVPPFYYQDSFYFPDPVPQLIAMHEMRKDFSSSTRTVLGAGAIHTEDFNTGTSASTPSCPFMLEAYKCLFDNFVATYSLTQNQLNEDLTLTDACGSNKSSPVRKSRFPAPTSKVAILHNSCSDEDVSSLYYQLVSGSVGSYSHFLALHYTSKYVLDIMDILYTENNDKGGVGRLFLNTTLIPVLIPYLKERRQFNVPAFESCCQLLYKMSLGVSTSPLEYFPSQLSVPQPCLFKLVRKDVWDLFSEPNFFCSASGESLLTFGKVLNQLLITEPSYFKDLLSHLSPINTSNSSIMQIFTRADAENKLKVTWLKKLAFVIFCGNVNQYENSIPEIQEKLVEYVTHSGSVSGPTSPDQADNGHSSSTVESDSPLSNPNVSRGSEILACSFLCFRVLLVRVNNARLSSLWPVILNESCKVLRDFWNNLKRICSQFLPMLLQQTLGEPETNGSSALTLQMQNLTLEGKTEPDAIRRRSSFRNTTSGLDILRKTNGSPGHMKKRLAPRPSSLPLSPSMALSSDQAPPDPVSAHSNETVKPKSPGPNKAAQLDKPNSGNQLTCKSFQALTKLLGSPNSHLSQQPSSPIPQNALNLLLSLCRLLDVAFALPPDTSLYFQSYVWTFVNYECYPKPNYNPGSYSRDFDDLSTANNVEVPTSPTHESECHPTQPDLNNTGSSDDSNLTHRSDGPFDSIDHNHPASIYKPTALQKIADLITALATLRDEFQQTDGDFCHDSRRLSSYSQDSATQSCVEGLALKGTAQATKLIDMLPFFTRLAPKERTSATVPPPSRECTKTYGETKFTNSQESVSRGEKDQNAPYVADLEAYILEDFCEGYEPNE